MGMSRTGSIMSWRLLLAAIVCVFVSGASVADRNVGWTDYLQKEGLTGKLSELPILHSHRVYQVSSFDRTGGNADGAYHYRNTKEGIVLAELDGPGAILRIWSPDPKGILRFYIDGEPWPRFSYPFHKLFEGHIVPFRPPFAEQDGGGYYSYLPIPFVETCDVVLAGVKGGDIPYQITACQFTGSTAGLKSFEPHILTNSDRYNLFKMRRIWNHPGRFGMPIRKNKLETVKRLMWPHDVVTFADFKGPGIIDGIWIEAESRDTEVAQKMPIECFWDDETDPSVSVVMADMFGTRNSNGDFRSMPIGNRDGQMYCYMPMPFRNHAVIKMRNPSREKVEVKVWVSWRSLDQLPDNMIMFHAQTRKNVAESGQGIAVLDAVGRGQYVGCVMSAASTAGTKFMEGDEEMFVDGELTPSLHGTGTADYFDSSSRFSAGTFTTATHGVPFLNETPGNSWFTGYRFHITDYVPFQKSFRMEFEHGAENDAPGTVYYTTAFWYQTEPHLALGVNNVAPPPPAPVKRMVTLIERHKTALEKAAEAKREEAKSQQPEPKPGTVEMTPVPVQPEPTPPATAVQ